MRNSLILVFLCISITVNATTYYVSTSGSDSNPGTITQPWATWQKGFNSISAGDILYIRGGTYTRVAGGSTNMFGVRVDGLKGTSASHFTISAYPGETPTLDCSSLNTTTSQNVGIGIYNSNYVDLIGLTVINVTQHAVNANAAPGFYESNVTYITHTQCTIHHCGDGFTIRDSYNYIYYINCDVYEIADTFDDPSGALPGSLANGFYCAPSPGTHIYYTGCRAWNCSDDGWDEFGGGGYIEITNCWAFNNGWCNAGGPIAYTKGDGSGFKLGPTTSSIEPGFQKILKNCLAIGNLGPGFDQNATGSTTNVRHAIYNCVTAFNTGDGFQYYWDHVSSFKNNISYSNGISYEFGSGSTVDHNSWQNGLVASSGDFAGIDATELMGPRKSDGSLPDITFMHLVPGSDMIDAGVDVGLTFNGSAPDLGAFEMQTGTTVTLPVYVSSTVQNTTPSLLEMTYNLTLANIAPATSSFLVLVNSISRTVNTVAISGTKVQLTIASPIVSGDAVTVSYTKPSSNTLQTPAAGQATTIGAQPVTNNVNPAIPAYVSSAVGTNTPSLLEMTYNLTLANIVPATSSFLVLVNSVSRTVNTIAISNTKVQLTLASRIFSGDVVTISYIKPSTNQIQTTSGGIATGTDKQPVINNCINIAPTVGITSPLTNSSFTSLTNIAITAQAADADGSVSNVEFYNGSTKLGSASSMPFSFTWNNVPAGNYNLTVIATDNQSARTTSSAVSISVTDIKHTQNRHPVIRIFNPHKGTTYDNLSTIEIDADASDPDGTISTVEFYNGQTKLVALTSAPYTYTLKDVVAGSYTITGIATDNMGDTTISSPIAFEVGVKVKYDANSDNINLYPNPNDGHFSIEFINPLQSEKGELIIMDLAGKQVYNGPVLKEEVSKNFDLSNTKSGIYVMMIRDKEILVTKKFIKN
jgi:uncharacterized repeat protein (TIGR02059 family)